DGRLRSAGGAREEAARRDDRRHGLPRPAGDSELLGLREELRAPGPHVRAERFLEPARAPVHGLRVVGALLAARGPDELRQRAAEPGPAAGRAGREWDAAGLRVDGPD